MVGCWDASPAHRPTFKELTPRLQQLLDAAREDEARGSGKGGSARGGLLSKLNLRGAGGGRGERS
jgi:hypothetical protein